MNKRSNNAQNKYLLDTKELKTCIALKEKIQDHIQILNHLYNTKDIPYTVMILEASEKSIIETIEYIRKTDIFVKIPYKQNFYIIMLQNTDSKSAIDFASRLTGLIKRNFMINKKTISHKLALISFEQNAPDVVELCYEITYTLKKFKQHQGNDYWVEIKRT